VRCTAGAIFDAIVDLRPGSPTRGRWLAVELCAETRRMLYVPEGFAHGFQTLRDGSEVFYQMTRAFAPAAARGFRWDDPSVGIAWPLPPGAMSSRDRELPGLQQEVPRG
jgi:dTDP-4-dehydrorhamnose 3,5-epimerase